MTATSVATLVALSDLVAERPYEEPAVDADQPAIAVYSGRQVEVVAVLQRTAIVRPDSRHPNDRATAKLADLLVDPGELHWRRRPDASKLEAAARGRKRWGEVGAPPARKAHAVIAPITTCECEGMADGDVCERRAPLGLLPHPGGDRISSTGAIAGVGRYVHCQRWLAEHEQTASTTAVEDDDESDDLEDDAGLELIAEPADTEPEGDTDPGPRVVEVERVGDTSPQPAITNAAQPEARSESQGSPAPSPTRCAKCGQTGRIDENGECQRHRARQQSPEAKQGAAQRLADFNRKRAAANPKPPREGPRQATVRCVVCGTPTHRVDVGACKRCEPLIERSAAATPCPYCGGNAAAKKPCCASQAVARVPETWIGPTVTVLPHGTYGRIGPATPPSSTSAPVLDKLARLERLVDDLAAMKARAEELEAANGALSLQNSRLVREIQDKTAMLQASEILRSEVEGRLAKLVERL